MWLCAKSREKVEDSFDVCWNCGTSKEGTEDPQFSPEPVAEAVELRMEPEVDPIVCPRCRCDLDYVGTKAFHEGTRWGALGDVAELFAHKEKFDVYCCPRCGRVEFFVDGIGEKFRPH